jgi:glucose/arabinose dehydrogenase
LLLTSVVVAVATARSPGADSEPSKPTLALKLVAEGFVSPLSYVPLPDGRVLIADQVGQVYQLDRKGRLDPEPVFNLTNRLSPVFYGAFDERGLIDVALHPKFKSNRKIYLTYTAPLRPGNPTNWNCTLRLSEFVLPTAEPLRVNPKSERILLEADKPFHNHNGGRLAFGPDGFLYMSAGDGGAANDEGERPATGNGQNLQTFLGKILRIDVSRTSAGKPYAIPSDNPFADGKLGRPEIYAYGMRNPWGISFDRGGKHELYAADVGQNLFEEVDIIVKGGNYGWSLREGFHGFDRKAANKPADPGVKVGALGEPLIDPIFEYRHPGPKPTGEPVGISITGGYVYRGRAIPSLRGHYVFGDWSRNFGLPDGVLFAAERPAKAPALWILRQLEVETPKGPKLGEFIVGFGQDQDGELYILTNSSNALKGRTGKVFKLVPAK